MSDFNAYITYDEYIEFGGKVDSTAFPFLERMAQRYLDSWTQDRIKYITSIPDTVKEAMVVIIDGLNDTIGGERISSFSNGKVSMNFDLSKPDEQEIYYNVSMILPLSLTSRAVDI